MLKLNYKLRVMNRTTLTAIAATAISIVYTVLGFFGIVPQVSEAEIVNVAALILELLTLLGVIVDPTTAGISDSERAMNYEKPFEDEL